MRRSSWAWLALFTGIVVYDLSAPLDETLTAGARRHPWLTYALVNCVTGHLDGGIPFDAIHWLGVRLRHNDVEVG